jgi:hypothetical protein
MQSALMQNALRAVAGLFGILFALNAAQWMVVPADAAEGLGMDLLSGAGRSTQIGDVGGLFVAMSVLIFAGLLRRNGAWLQAASLMVASAAVMRCVAWAFHEAAFVAPAIAVEVLTAIVLWAAARFTALPALEPQ